MKPSVFYEIIYAYLPELIGFDPKPIAFDGIENIDMSDFYLDSTRFIMYNEHGKITDERLYDLHNELIALKILYYSEGQNLIKEIGVGIRPYDSGADVFYNDYSYSKGNMIRSVFIQPEYDNKFLMPPADKLTPVSVGVIEGDDLEGIDACSSIEDCVNESPDIQSGAVKCFYSYDEHKNWIEEVSVYDGNISLYRKREIKYFK